MELDPFSSRPPISARGPRMKLDLVVGGPTSTTHRVRAFQADCRQIEWKRPATMQPLTVAEVLPRLRTRNHE
jgi:hypothetical protein